MLLTGDWCWRDCLYWAVFSPSLRAATWSCSTYGSTAQRCLSLAAISDAVSKSCLNLFQLAPTRQGEPVYNADWWLTENFNRGEHWLKSSSLHCNANLRHGVTVTMQKTSWGNLILVCGAYSRFYMYFLLAVSLSGICNDIGKWLKQVFVRPVHVV